MMSAQSQILLLTSRLPNGLLCGVCWSTFVFAGCGEAQVDVVSDPTRFQIKSHQDAVGNQFAYTLFQRNQQADHGSLPFKLPLFVLLNGRGQYGNDIWFY